jgi:hypothetical protein
VILPIGAPALPLDEAGKYVAAAYIVFVLLLLVYVAIMAARLQRVERELKELAGFAEQRTNSDQAAPGRGSGTPSISDSLAAHGAEEAAPYE